MSLIDALHELDHSNDKHWTVDGLPKLQAVHELIGHDNTIRKDITNLVPDFNRDNPLQVSDGIPTAEAEVLEINPSPEEEEVDEPEEVDEELLAGLIDQLKDDIAEIDQNIEKLKESRENLNKKEAKLNAERDELVLELETHDPKMTNQEAIGTFIKSQNAQKMERHKKAQAALANIDLEGLSTASKLDKALGRNTSRGSQRPKMGT